MNKIILFIFILFPLLSYGQQPQAVKFQYIESLLKNNYDTTYVINFWATWCKPCVKELAEFEKLNEISNGKKIKVILVSLDFKRQLSESLIPFVKERKLKSFVVLLDEPDYNSWINKVDTTWGGAIPATLIINNKRKVHRFFEKELTFNELQKII